MTISPPTPPGPRAVRGSRILTPDGVRPASIHIDEGHIARVAPIDDLPTGAAEVIDTGDLLVLPGLVDTHVHVNEPGRTEWEGFETATRAAAAGGVTALLDMPLNSIPATTTVAALRAKADAAAGKAWVDVGFIGGVVPGNASALGALAEAGVVAFKCFLVPSGVPEFPHVGEADLREALPVLAERGRVLMVHAEAPSVVDAATRAVAGEDPRRYSAWLASRPAAAECEAVALVIRLAEEYGARAHVVHVSSAASISLIAAARRRHDRVTAETCPHYLSFDASAIPDGATEYKCAPPVRTAADRDALWAALRAGVLDMVVSDHSPCPPAMKRSDTGDFFAAWGGIASLQLGLSVVWTGMRERGLPIDAVASWMCEAPARLAGMLGRKGRIAAGQDADLVFFDPDAEWTVTTDRLWHRHPITPYLGSRLRGRVEATYVRGVLAYDHARGPVPAPPGQVMLPDSSGR